MICEKKVRGRRPVSFRRKERRRASPCAGPQQRAIQPGGSLGSLDGHDEGASPWPGDVPIVDLGSAGLKVACIVRLKSFTPDNRLILRRVGDLSKDDRSGVAAAVSRYHH